MAASEDAIILRIADTIGGLIEFWGFKRGMGRMWAIIYLAQEPMSAAELQDRLSMSAGAVSMTLAELVKWGVVKKTWVPGERKDFYEPETSIWKMMTRVFRERELTHIREAIEVLEDALVELAKSDRKRVRFLAERIESLMQVARVGEALLSAILDGRKIDLGQIRALSDT
jgi:DNA-binding transcriptional regulator GbsR (MarR family)